MKAMVLHGPGQALVLEERPMPRPGPGQLLVEVSCCGVCRTDLHIQLGELIAPHYPVILGHEVVGRVTELGEGVESDWLGTRVGLPWLAGSCGRCPYCARGEENLCDEIRCTGFHRDGGYAEFVLADPNYSIVLPPAIADASAAPLLCAGLIGFRAYRLAGEGTRLGLYGFGAAAHLLAQLAAQEGREVYAFTRKGDTAGQELARSLGACWAGASSEPPPVELDAALIFAPVGALVPTALAAVRKGGKVICAGIHMSDIPAFPYRILWGERSVCSVANLTRADGEEYFDRLTRYEVLPRVALYSLEDANEALAALRSGALEGAAVLMVR